MTRVLLLLLLPLMLFASPLHDAVKNNNLQGIEAALKKGVNINVLKKGKTALTAAVSTRNLDLVKLLIKKGANLHNGTVTPLLQALLLEDIEIASYLIDKGAEVNEKGFSTRNSMLYDLLLERKYKSVILLLENQAWFSKKKRMAAFYLALTYAPFDVIKAFIARDVPMNQRDSYLGTPIDIALRYKRNDVLKYLVDHGASIVNYSHYLTVATKQNNTEAVKILVDGEIKVSKRNQHLLAKAIKADNLEILKYLVEAGGDLDLKNRAGDTPLVIALKHKRVEIAEWIIDQGISSKHNAKALFYTIHHGDTNATLKMLDQGIGVKQTNKEGLTSLLWALKHKRFETAKALIEEGAFINKEDNLGETALFKVIRLHEPELLKMLLVRGAKINFYNKEGVTPLYKSVETANYKAFKMLIDSGATLEENEIEKSEIYLAVDRGLTRFYFYLKNRTPMAYYKDSQGNRLIHIAAKKDRLDILRMMLFNRVNTEYTNDKGETPLHVAAKEGMLGSVALLTFFHANLDALDERNRSVKTLAKVYKRSKVVKWIERYQFERDRALKEIQNQQIKSSDANLSQATN
ncbi:MAG: ankyrin repeat domain-containing protein [Thiovulaceae bacterium]|nr:ankyrin repeat domain-containing protein [Sulfurimonadaceae bacterium]